MVSNLNYSINFIHKIFKVIFHFNFQRLNKQQHKEWFKKLDFNYLY